MIIDLESARVVGDTEKPRQFTHPIRFLSWGLAGPEIDIREGGIDPMVPYSNKPGVFNFDDAALKKMAADSDGKEVYFWDRRRGRISAEEKRGERTRI